MEEPLLDNENTNEESLQQQELPEGHQQQGVHDLPASTSGVERTQIESERGGTLQMSQPECQDSHRVSQMTPHRRLPSILEILDQSQRTAIPHVAEASSHLRREDQPRQTPAPIDPIMEDNFEEEEQERLNRFLQPQATGTRPRVSTLQLPSMSLPRICLPEPLPHHIGVDPLPRGEVIARLQAPPAHCDQEEGTASHQNSATFIDVDLTEDSFSTFFDRTMYEGVKDSPPLVRKAKKMWAQAKEKFSKK